MATYVIIGASRGIGLGLAEHYARQAGANVYAGARDPEGARLKRLAVDGPGSLATFPIDIDDPASIESAAREIGGRGKIDALLVVAGITNDQSFGDVKADDLIAVLRTNVVGPALAAQAFAPYLAPGAKVINMSSILGSIERADGSAAIAYAVSKAALNMLTKQESHHLPGGATVVSLHPGWVQTEMGGDGATLTIEESVGAMARVIDGLTPAANGTYLDYRGESLPW